MGQEQSLTGRPRERAKAHVKATRPPVCELCGYPIQMDADPFRHPLAPAVDERLPRKLGGSAIDPDNLALVMRLCNGIKGAQWPVTDELRARCRAAVEAHHRTHRPTIRSW